MPSFLDIVQYSLVLDGECEGQRENCFKDQLIQLKTEILYFINNTTNW